MQFSVARLYIEWGNFSRGRELLSMCIGTFRRKKGARLAVAYETAAHIEERSGRYTDALAELASAAKVGNPAGRGVRRSWRLIWSIGRACWIR